MLLLCFLAVSAVLAQETGEQGHVLNALGAGVKGNGVLLATAEMMRGPGAALLSKAATESVREHLKRVRALIKKETAERGGTLKPRKKGAKPFDVAARTMDVPPVHKLLRQIVAIVMPTMNDTKMAVHDLIQQVLVFERDTRRAIDKVRAAVAERMKHVRARQAFQVEELMAVDAAVKLNDGLTIRNTLGPKATREDFQRVSRQHDRVYQQVMRAHTRLSHSERRAQRVAASLIADLLINKAAVLDSNVARVVYRMVGVYNKRGVGAPGLVQFAAELAADSEAMEEEQARLFSASGALLSAIAVSNERTISSLVRDFLNITNHAKSPTELDEAFDLAVARRNARVFAHRTIRSLEALFINNDIAKRADLIRRISTGSAHHLLQEEEIAVRARLDRMSYYSSKPDDFDLAALAIGSVKTTNNTVEQIDTRDFLRLARQIDVQFELDQFKAPLIDLKKDEVPILVGDMVHANRLADNIERIAGGEAAYSQAKDDFAEDNRVAGFKNLAKAERLFVDFLMPRPGPSSYGESDIKMPGNQTAEDEEKAAINTLQSSSIVSVIDRRGLPVMWGKYGHHPKLRRRVFRNGVAVDRVWVRKVSTPSRYRLDRLQRALNGANLQFSRDVRRRNAGILEGEDRLAERIMKINGKLEDSTMNRFEDDEKLHKKVVKRRRANEAVIANNQKELLNSAFDVAATGKLSALDGDVVKVDISKLLARENVGKGGDGFNQYARADSTNGVNRIQGFMSQVNQGRSAANVKMEKMVAQADVLGRQMRGLMGRAARGLKKAQRATAQRVLSTVRDIKRLAAAGQGVQLSAMVRKTVEDSRRLMGGLRQQVMSSIDGVKKAVEDARSGALLVVGNANVFLGRARDAQPAIRAIVEGLDRGGVTGAVEMAKAVEQIAAMLPGAVGKRMAQIANQAETTVSKQLLTVEQKVREVANRVRGAGLTVDSIEVIAREIRNKGLRAGFQILRTPHDGAGVGNGGGTAAAPLPPGVGVTLGVAGQVTVTGPVLARALGRAFAPLFNPRPNRRCIEWRKEGRVLGVVVRVKDAINKMDRKCLPRKYRRMPAIRSLPVGSWQHAILTREPCALWHRAGSVRIIGRTCRRAGDPAAPRFPRRGRLAFQEPTLPLGAVNCTSEGPFFGSPIDTGALNPEFQCGARTPESILFALRQEPKCVTFQRTGAWTMPLLTPLQQELLGRGLFFERERHGDFFCGPRQAPLTKVFEDEFLKNATTTATTPTVRP
jgi:hypothetical protein